MVDYRLEWFKERVLTLLEEVDDSIFTDLLISDEGQTRDQLVNFIGDDVNELSGKDKKVVFFYKTFQQKLIEPRVAAVAKGNQQNGKSRLTAALCCVFLLEIQNMTCTHGKTMRETQTKSVALPLVIHTHWDIISVCQAKA